MRNRAIIAFVVLLAPLAAGGDGRAAMNAEGEVYHFHEGDSYTWDPPSETYLLVVSSGAQGARVDMQDMYAGHPQASNRPYGPPESTSMTAVEFEGRQRGLRILEGSGKLTLARIDFARGLPLEGPIDQLDAQGFLDGGACRSYGFSKLRMDKPYAVAANGTGLTFALFNWFIEPLSESQDSLVWVLDPNLSDEKGFVLQACNEGTGRLPFAARITYPAPTTTTKNTPAPDFAMIALGIAATMFLSRRRHQWT